MVAVAGAMIGRAGSRATGRGSVDSAAERSRSHWTDDDPRIPTRRRRPAARWPRARPAVRVRSAAKRHRGSAAGRRRGSVRERRRLDRDLLHLRRVEPVPAAGLAVAPRRDAAPPPGPGARPRRTGRARGSAGSSGSRRPRRPRRRPPSASDRAIEMYVGLRLLAQPRRPSPRRGPPRGSRRRTAASAASSAPARPVASPAARQPRGRRPRRRGTPRRRARRGRGPATIELLSAATKYSAGKRLLRVQHGADGREGDGQPVAERLGVLVGPEELEERLARRRPAAPRDEDLEQVAGLLRLPRGRGTTSPSRMTPEPTRATGSRASAARPGRESSRAISAASAAGPRAPSDRKMRSASTAASRPVAADDPSEDQPVAGVAVRDAGERSRSRPPRTSSARLVAARPPSAPRAPAPAAHPGLVAPRPRRSIASRA